MNGTTRIALVTGATRGVGLETVIDDGPTASFTRRGEVLPW